MKRRDLFRVLGAVGALAVPGAQRPAAARRSTSLQGSGGESLASRLAASIRKHNVPGASVAIHRGGQWEIAAGGVANVITGVEVTPDTLMHIGSITKVLNATLVMQLVDEGRLDLSAPVRRYLPDFRVVDREATGQITVGMLLNHTSGIDGEYFPSGGPDGERIEDAVRRIAQQRQIHRPGAELSYCNAGAVLGGYLVQRTLEKSWYSLIEERIFRPLDLQDSVVEPADALLHRAAVGHFSGRDGTNTRTSSAFLNASFAPAGTTAMMSARDLATFALTHMNDGIAPNGYRLLSAASAGRMRQQTATWRGVGGGGFGLGWTTIDNGIVGHDGGGPGIASFIYADPASKTVAAVLTNAAHGGAVIDDITNPLYRAAGATPFQAEALEVEKQAISTRVDPRPFVGEYESVALGFRVISHGDGIAFRIRPKVLFYDGDTFDESPLFPLRPMPGGHFTSDQRFVTFLNPDAKGRMQHLASRRRLYGRV